MNKLKAKIVGMKPGRALDIEVALHVMGFIWLKHLLQFSAELAVKWLGTPEDIEQSGGVYTALTKESELISLKQRENFDEAVPKFSTEIGAAEQVLERMKSLGYTYISKNKIEQEGVLFYGRFDKEGIDSEVITQGFVTEAEVIVKAALATVLPKE
jgi:hypothetical protein